MKQYKDYIVEDFLLDDDFLEWERAGCPQTGTIWLELLTVYPEKKEVIDEAKVFIEHQRKGTNLPILSSEELTEHISKVLARTHSQKVPLRYLNSSMTWWRVAAAVILLIGICWGIVHWESGKSPFAYEMIVRSSTTPLTEIVNANQTSQSKTLPDGSRIQLAKNAKISYSTQMDKEPSRIVYLSGEAFFEVRKDSSHPFLVYAGGLVTRVVGTSFIIRTVDKQVSVVVRTGRVTVYPMNGAEKGLQAKEKLMLTPNQQATFVAEKNQLTRAVASQPVSLSKAGQPATLQFDNTPIAAVFAQLEKNYGIPIQYDAGKMKNCFLTSTLADEPFYSKLSIICQTIGANYTVQGTQIVISSMGCE